VSTPAEDARAEAERRTEEYAKADDADGVSDTADRTQAGGGIGGRVKHFASRADEVHQRTPWLAVPVAVFKKFGDDRGGNWAALIAYYGFFSLFPLLLAFTTVLGLLVRENEELRQRLTDTALANFPVVGNVIKVEALEGSAIALVVGLATAIWAGMGVILSVQGALDDIWDVPRRARPNFLTTRVRAFLALMTFGVGIVVTAGLGTIGGTSDGLGLALRGLALLVTFALNVAIFAAAYRFLTVAEVTWRQTLPGAITAGAGWMLLLALGSWFVDSQIEGASQTYGTFAFVIGLLAWLALSAQLMLLAAELNVVLARRLWPRALQPPPLTPADRDVLTAQAEEEQTRPTQDVEVSFDPPDAPREERRS
jgi:membrane protein